ncbi:hypothetical protein [Ascidiimonas aurantiaca]|uniref:hypothetical protein n=1 Tax=Ascidiimonas aurantiaca TaxID=1685432 RepID=UPI0030EB6AEA
MEKHNPFMDIDFTHIEAPKELKSIIIQNVESMKLLIELCEYYDKTNKAAMSSLFKTDFLMYD